MSDDDARLLRDLVALPSPTGATADCAAFLARAMRGRGLEAEVDGAGNAVGVAGQGPVEVMLCGHLDTVPGDLPVRLADGVLWGRGSVDAKGALAAFVAAAARHARSDALRVTVVGCCDEEGDSHGARHLVPRHRPAHLVVGEPSGTRGVTLGYKGMVKVRYALEDDGQHQGAPHPSVPDRGFAFWAALQAWLAPQHGDSLFTTPTAKLASFTTQALPDGRERVALRGSVRTPPGFDTEALLAFLRARAGDGTLELPEVLPSWVAGKNTPVARAFVAGVRAQGLAPRYLRKTGTSDMNVLAPAWGVPCVAYGPGDASLDHTPHERLPLAELHAAVEVVDHALRALATAGGAPAARAAARASGSTSSPAPRP